MYSDVYNLRSLACQNIPEKKRNGMDFNLNLEYGEYEDVGTPINTKSSWLARKIGQFGSIRSNKSSSSSSTYIYGFGLSKKSFHKSQLSLYDKISRKINLFDNNKGDGRSRKSSRQRLDSETCLMSPWCVVTLTTHGDRSFSTFPQFFSLKLPIFFLKS